MLQEGHFYPYKTMSAEERLWWYSRHFDVVSVPPVPVDRLLRRVARAWPRRLARLRDD
jgi:hypothetical protein